MSHVLSQSGSEIALEGVIEAPVVKPTESPEGALSSEVVCPEGLEEDRAPAGNVESPAGNGAVGGPVPAKRRKTGGRKRGSANKLGKEARLFLAEHSNYLQTLCRLAQGRPIRLSRQRGHKPEWVRPSLNDMKWALEIIINRLIPTVAQAEIGGIEDGVPVAVTASEPHDMREVARRLALVFTRGDPLAGVETRAGSAVAPVAAPTSAFSAFAQNAPQNGPQAPVAASGGPDTSAGTPDSPAAAEADDGPKVPKVGQTAYLDYAVRITNNGPQRDGLPNTFVITDATGKIIKHCGGDYEGAVKWARRQFDLPDAKITIATDRPEPAQFDQRELPVPVVTRSHQVKRDFLP